MTWEINHNFMIKPVTKTDFVNLRQEKFDIYIGRGNRYGQKGLYGNPYYRNDNNREAAIAKYEPYIKDKLMQNTAFMLAFLTLKDKVLGCYCKPKHCHGEVLISILNYLFANLEKEIAPLALKASENQDLSKEEANELHGHVNLLLMTHRYIKSDRDFT